MKKYIRKRTVEYIVWEGIKYRCLNKNCKQYHRYGGRGIKICKRWMKFKNFLKDMGIRPKGFSIDRINNNGNYKLSNCRWTDSKTQSRNRSTVIMIRFNNKTQCAKDWAKELGINQQTLSERLRMGWSKKRALCETVDTFHNKKRKIYVGKY